VHFDRCLCRGLLPYPQSAGGPIRQRVGPNLIAVTVMASDPGPAHAKPGVEFEQLDPNRTVLQWAATPVAPTVALPAEDKAAHAINQEFGIRIEFDMGPIGEWPEGLDSSHQLHLRDGGPGAGPVRFPTFGSMDDNEPPAAGSRITDGRAVGENAIRLIHEEPPSLRTMRKRDGNLVIEGREPAEATQSEDQAACMGMTSPNGAFWLPVEAHRTG
jgi:hypothetical protein